GSIWLLFIVAIADALLGTALGLLASAFARTEFQVVQFMPVFVFPQILLGGIFLPRTQLPDVLEVIGDWLPLSHAIDALDAVSTGNEDEACIWLRVLFIVCWIVGAIIVGSLTLRRRTPGGAASSRTGTSVPSGPHGFGAVTERLRSASLAADEGEGAQPQCPDPQQPDPQGRS